MTTSLHAPVTDAVSRDPITPSPSRADARPFVVASALSIAWCTTVFAWLVSGESLNFTRSVPLSNFYDVQARALMAGHWYVPHSSLWLEGIHTGNHTYMYYGPVPALLRIPVLLVTHRLDGRLTAISLMIAYVVALVFVSRLSWKVRLLVRGDDVVSRAEAAWAGAWLAVIGLGSVLLFLGSDILVYHEAELWGVALALGAFDAIVGFLMRPSWPRIVVAGVLATLAIMTRSSVGAGPVVTLGLLALGHGAVAVSRRYSARAAARRPAHARGDVRNVTASSTGPGGHHRTLEWLGIRAGGGWQTWFRGLGLVTLGPLICAAWVNEIKFSSLFSVPLNRQYYVAVSPIRRAALASNHGSLFSYRYIPTSLVAYLRPDALHFTRLFPFVTFPGPATIVGHVVYDTRDWNSSVTSSMTVLFIAALIGLVMIVAPRRAPGDRIEGHGQRWSGAHEGPQLALLRLVLVGAAAGTVGVLMIAFIAERYLADMVPLVVICGLVGFHAVVHRLETTRRPVRITVRIAVVVLALFGIWTNLALGLVYQRVIETSITPGNRNQLVSLQAQVNARLFGGSSPPVMQVATLPRPPLPGGLAVVGACQGLYQSDGRNWFVVEKRPPDGALALTMTFGPTGISARQPVIEIGTPGNGAAIAVQQLSGHRALFSYRSLAAGQAWVDGSPVDIGPGRLHHLMVAVDPRTDDLTVTLDGVTGLQYAGVAIAAPLSDSRAVQLGRAPAIAGMLPRYSGTLTPAPDPTPICSSLLRRR